MSRIAGMAPGGPKAVGPYSHYVVANGFVFVSGMGPMNPATGQIELGTVAEQTRLALDNVATILAAAGSSMDKVCRCGVFLADMADFPEMNAVYAEYFPENPPARTTIAAKALPAGISVEIDAIAVVD